MALAIAFPVALFPFSRTVWIAMDLVFHPPRARLRTAAAGNARPSATMTIRADWRARSTHEVAGDDLANLLSLDSSINRPPSSSTPTNVPVRERAASSRVTTLAEERSASEPPGRETAGHPPRQRPHTPRRSAPARHGAPRPGSR